MEENPKRICELLVGLGDVEVSSVDDAPGAPLGVHIRSRAPWPACGGCGGSVWSKGASAVGLVDLPCECRIPGRGWSGPMSVLADESAASCRLPRVPGHEILLSFRWVRFEGSVVWWVLRDLGAGQHSVRPSPPPEISKLTARNPEHTSLHKTQCDSRVVTGDACGGAECFAVAAGFAF